MSGIATTQISTEHQHFEDMNALMTQMGLILGGGGIFVFLPQTPPWTPPPSQPWSRQGLA